jgi:hypothetical protein
MLQAEGLKAVLPIMTPALDGEQTMTSKEVVDETWYVHTPIISR